MAVFNEDGGHERSHEKLFSSNESMTDLAQSATKF